MENRTAATLERLFSLESRVGVITGQSSGLGLAISRVLADAGARVYGLNRTVRDEAEHPGVTQIRVDLTDDDALAAVIQDIGERDGLDFAVNNAGITAKCRAEELDRATWEAVSRTNVDALFRVCQLTFPYLSRSRHVGRIVNIASMASYWGFAEVVPYSATKSAVLGITRGLAVEWAADNVLVNAVAPGWFPSQMNRRVLDADPARARKIMAKIALGRYGDPEDIGAAVLFLVSDAARYITGVDYAVDGGAQALGF